MQSSPKRTTRRKKYISNLKLFSTDTSYNNQSSSSRTFANNRTPNSWTFAMISHNNRGLPLNQTTNYDLSSTVASRNNNTTPIGTSRSSTTNNAKQLSSTRRPFLSRSINYQPPPVALMINNSSKTLESNARMPSEGLKPEKQQRKPLNLRSGRPPKSTTLVAISTTTGNHPINFNPFQFMQSLFDQIFPKGNSFLPWVN